MTYLTAIERTHDNPLTGSAQYRVKRVEKMRIASKSKRRVLDLGWMRSEWYLLINKRYRTGTFINPKKALGLC